MPTVPAIPTLTVPSADKARTALTDVAYVGVGAAVLTAQQVQVARKEIQERIEDSFAKLVNLDPSDVRTEVRSRIENFAKAGREALGKRESLGNKNAGQPESKTTVKTSKAAA